MTEPGTMEDMTIRQSLPTIRAALLPDSMVRVYWRPSGQRTPSQITGTVISLRGETLTVMPMQGQPRRPKTLHLERVHSVTVLREGEAAKTRRATAADHLRRAAFYLSTGSTGDARAQLVIAGTLIPGVIPDPIPTEES